VLLVFIGGASCCAQQQGASAEPRPSQNRPQDNVARSYPLGIAPESTPLYPELKQAFDLAQARKSEEAIAGFKAAGEKAVATQDLPAQALAHEGLSWIFDGKAEFPAARKESELALEVLEKSQNVLGAAQIHTHLGKILDYLGDIDSAREHFQQAVNEFEALGMLREKATALKGLAMTGAPDAGKLQEQALAIARQVGDKYLEAGILENIGDNLFAQGQFAGAQQDYSQAIAILEQMGSPRDLAYALTSEGRLLRAHGHAQEAIALYQRALEIQQKSGDRAGAIQSINAIAVAYDHLEDYKAALVLYEKALAMARETGSSRVIDFQSANLANSYNNAGRYQEAIDVLVDLAPRDVEYGNRRYEALAEAYSHLGRYPEAVTAIDKAIELGRSKQDWEGLNAALLRRIEIAEKLGNQDQALADAQEALHVIEDVRAHVVPSDFMKRGFSDHYQKTYHAYVRALVHAQQFGRALEVAEEARGRAFLDLLATREIEGPRGRQLASLRKAQEQLLAQGVDLSGSPAASTAGMVTRGSHSATDQLWNEWSGADAELRSLVSAQPFSVAQLQATARRLNSTVLSYWVSSDGTYIWVVPADGPTHSAVVDVSEKRLQELISALGPGGPAPKKEASGPSADEIAKSIADEPVAPHIHARGGAVLIAESDHGKNWRELYKLLIQPVEKWLPVKPGSLLTIEPHGPLLMLPFAALKNVQGHYLLERFSLHYTPAVSVLQFTEKKEKETRQLPAHYLLIADPSGTPKSPEEGVLPALPGARREISAVARLMPAHEVTILEGSQAAEDQVWNLAGQSTVIHFATHGIIRDDQPFDSFLALGKSRTDPKEDGRLTAQKIYSMDLHANLVFLSAYRSGLGKVTGDGLVGLTRAFWYAGTPSVIASLWDVADEPTYELVASFYRSRLEGKDKSSALRLAQLHLLHELRSGRVVIHTSSGQATLPEDPMFWAGFALQGEP
jgi:CHAT domain-containing protein/tetratricopeptide (TPR) repeat protein